MVQGHIVGRANNLESAEMLIIYLGKRFTDWSFSFYPEGEPCKGRGTQVYCIRSEIKGEKTAYIADRENEEIRGQIEAIRGFNVGRGDQPIHDFRAGDSVRRKAGLNPENPAHTAGLQLSVNTTYKVLWVDPKHGLCVLEDVLILIHPDSIYPTTQ